jgi:hypothetical protein
MDNKNVEIHDDEINVKDIMGQIRENIRRRQTAEKVSADPDSLISPSPYSEDTSENNKMIFRDRTFINSNWDIHNNSYFIS